MPNPALRNYLRVFLNSLGPKGEEGRAYSFENLIDASNGVTRNAFYNWLSGARTGEQIAKSVAEGLFKLGQETGNSTKDASALEQDLAGILKNPAVWADFKAFSYQPICGEQEKTAEWNFLGTIVERFLFSSGREPEKVNLPPCTIDEADLQNEDAVLVGLFARPSLMAEWDFIRTPIKVPLNAIVLQRDLDNLLEQKTPGEKDRLSTQQNYLKNVQAFLWQTCVGAPPEIDHFRTTLRPISQGREAGRSYLKQLNAFSAKDLEYGPKGLEPRDFLQKLVDLSPKRTRSRGEAEASLPIIVADELTCFRILAYATKNKLDEVRLVSEPSAEVRDPLRAFRPSYTVSLAVRRDRAAASAADPNSFEATRRSFEEFIRSNASMVAHHYVHLYRALLDIVKIEERSSGLEKATFSATAPLYFLRWLSLAIDEGDFGQSGQVSDSTRAGLLAGVLHKDIADPWVEVLHTARAILIEDQELRSRLKAAFENSSAPLQSAT